ncbi:probable glycosyltransferase At5g03795 isoform X1 [Diospyros lotus]|uniref:probable glycosyltransferase At5g03795 isoform X1 n=1 Tax=Diospyros lotus TaxID=55363 RepID=UPI002256AE7B|nr:probable glycosyltransferase At5g03795 isoform X1 [Diospyros lotus]XP_052202675.1 probable glycosyltransferase At5g03795 isoform X1 [Diospyros lotus]XP_052202676.1 probable glycosyltransferase At5g03795 isoform X1 [Diospyros lotus]
MKLLRKIIIFLVLRIDWRKLLLIGSFFTIVGVVVQISTLPYPLTIWVFSSSDLPLLYISMNSNVHLNEKNSLMRLEQFETHAVVSMNTSTVLNPLVSTNTSTVLNHVVSTNTSTVLNQSMSIVEERPISSRKRGQSSKRQRRHRKAEDIVAYPPRLRPVPHRLLRYVRSLTPYEALVYAKKEMENISSVINDPDPELYAPLFRNVSVFQRSYELMELLLKVYIYQDGKRPIFHEPILRGIYSSEGWFMKLMEENRQFVTQDPEKAHLFYLPYSAKQLQTALYVPNSHNIRRLSFFLRDHVNMLAAKYPFWNRTRGSDHFLVACHDWGPYTLTEHEELTKNTIKALCNADASEGIFVAGKDVSLPETTIRNPKRPLRGLGGNRVSQRPILAFFAGHMHGRVRPTLLKYWNGKDEDMRIYRVLPNRVSRNMSYPLHMKSSKYCICPMGYEVNSPRIVESIYHECVPVIIADNFVPPLNEVLDWSSFSVIVEEKDIPKLKDILLSIPLKRYIKMQTNVKMLQKHFHWNARPIRYDMFHMILHSIWHARLNQIQIQQRS